MCTNRNMGGVIVLCFHGVWISRTVSVHLYVFGSIWPATMESKQPERVISPQTSPRRRSSWILKFTTNFPLCVSLPLSAKVWVISWWEAEFHANKFYYPNKGTMQPWSSPEIKTELKAHQHSHILSSQFIVSFLDFYHFILFNHVCFFPSFPYAIWCAKLIMAKLANFLRGTVSAADTQLFSDGKPI